MARSAGISGVGVAAATAGALLMYAGIRDVSVLETLREVTSGKLPEGNKNRQSSTTATAARAALNTTGSAGVPSGGIVQTSGAGGFKALADAALRYRGVPYKWGGATAAGLDCSGLVQLAFRDNGIEAPRTTYQQIAWRALTRIDASQAGAGDLVFWPGHVAIVVSPGTVVHAPRPGKSVEVVPVGSAGPRGQTPTYRRYAGAKAAPKTARA